MWLRRSCVKLGYFKDDFVRYFVRRPGKRSPLINRGENVPMDKTLIQSVFYGVRALHDSRTARSIDDL